MEHCSFSYWTPTTGAAFVEWRIQRRLKSDAGLQSQVLVYELISPIFYIFHTDKIIFRAMSAE